MGLSSSRPPREGVYAHLRDQMRLIADLQTYLNRVEKLLADSEAAHKGVRRAVESFFPADSPSHEVVLKLMQSMKVFEQVRSDLRSHTNTARRTFQTLLDKAHHLERLVKERDKLSRKVEAHEKNLEKLRLKYTTNPTPALQKRLAKAEDKYNTISRQFKMKNVETELETSNAMDGRYAEAATLVSQSALIIIQYVQMTAPEMEKAQSLLALLQQSTGALQATPLRPITPASSAAHAYTSQHSEPPLRGAQSLGDPSQPLYHANQQPSNLIAFPEKTETSAAYSGDQEPYKSMYQVQQPAPSTVPSPDVSPHLRVFTEKEKFAALSVESSGQTQPSGGGLASNPFENDL